MLNVGILLLIMHRENVKNSTHVIDKTYFRIQGKYQTCSERTSYRGNGSLPDYPKLMKVLVTVGLNRLSSLHIPSWHITLFTFS